ncbi:MAG: carboxypeptidase regulatory-like domain-containing protein [Holophagaceae bacterium]|nr:carboxypeptidase regulatory-like domain-containing protein [Holophagaceae bacterium]
MSARGLRGTFALALGLLMSTMPCQGARHSTNPSAAAPVARVATHAAALTGASPLRSGALASGELHLVGLRLVAPSARIDVPQNAPFTVPVALYLGNRVATAAEINQLVPSNAQLVGTFSGPSVNTQTLTGTASTGLNIPGLPVAGDYTLSDIRLVNGSTTILQAEPTTVTIRCLGEVLIGSVSSSPMTLAEMREAGIQLGQGNYEARRFTMALSIGSRRVDLSVPVAIPVYNGLASLIGEAQAGRLEIKGEPGMDDPLPDINVALADIRMESTFALSRPDVAHLVNHGFKALVVIPGSIGYLHQFYKVNLLVLNILPDGSPYVVRNVRATAMLPTGADGGVGTADDPLRLAIREAESAEPTKSLLGPGANGQPGTGSTTLAPGESGSATWYMEAMKEGAHLFSFRINGEFSGGTLTGPIPIQGEARAGLLVKNPTFDLALIHPDVVRRGETYTLEARLTNTSGTLANGVSLNLDQTRLANVKLMSAPSQTIETLAPGASATFKFQLKALKTGQVIGSYLYMESGTIGFQLSTGIGERNIQLDPDTLVLPQTLDKLPENVREGMLRVLGQAHSIITTKAALPPGVLPIRGSTLSQILKPSLNEAGLFLGMGVDKGRIWGDLWRAFTRSGDPGLDQLMRQTAAGQDFRSAMVEALSSWAGVASPLNIVGPLASWSSGTVQPIFAAVEGTAGLLSVGIVGADGSLADPTVPMPTLSGAWAATASKGNTALAQMAMPPAGAQLRVLNTASVDQDVNLRISSPLLNSALPATLNYYTLRIPTGGVATVNLGVVRGPAATITSPSGNTGQAVSNDTQDVSAEPFKVLAVHRYDLEMDPNATPFGTQVMLLFNRPNSPVALSAGPDGFAAGSAMVDIEANRLWLKAMTPGENGELPPSPPAIIQQSPRTVSLYLEKPVGPNIPRNLTLKSGWVEQGGGSGLTGTYPIQSGWIPGGAVVKGKVRKTTGEGLPGSLSYWYFVSFTEGGLDLATGISFGQLEEDYYALISNNIALEADGSFQLDYVPEPAKTALGPFTLQGKTASGSAFGVASVLGNGQVIEMDLVLEGKGDVIGTVKDGNGLPIDQVQLEVYQEQPSYGLAWSSGATRISAISDAQGNFAFRGLKTGVFSLRAMKGLLGAAASGEIGRDGQVVTQDIVLKGQTGNLEVQVLNVDGSPRANQTVLLGIAAGLLRSGEKITYVFPQERETDAQGKARFTDVPAGDVAAVLPKMRTTVSPAWYGFLKEGETLKATLQVPDVSKMGQVEVTVSDSKGNPLPDAAIYWEQNPNPNIPAAHSDAEGKALIPAPAGAIFSVVARHPDWPPSGGRSAGVTPLAGKTVQLPVSMPPRAWLKGKVTRPSGAPVVGAYVAIPPVSSRPSLNRLTQTDAQGNYRLSGISTASGERVTCVGSELLTFSNQTAQGLPEQDLALNFVLPDVGQNRLKGHVYQPKESGQNIGTIANLEVYGDLPDISTGDGNPNFGLPLHKLIATTRSSTDGSYAMAGLPIGPFEVTGKNDFFPTLVSATGLFEGSTQEKIQDLTLFSTFTGAMEGQVTRPDGQTKAGAGIRIRLLGGGVGEIQVETDATGHYAFPKVIPSGRYQLRAEDPQSGAIAAGSVYLEQETNRIRNIRLLGKGNLTLHLQDADGKILPDGDVALAHELGNTLDASDFPPMTDKLLPSMGGEMIFSGLWEGLVQVHLRAPNGILHGRASVRMPQGGGDSELTLRLQSTGGVSGHLHRADGSLVNAGRVDAYTYVDPTAQSHYQWVGVSTTRQNGEDGRFIFEDYPLGPFGWKLGIPTAGKWVKPR